jgi:hypothetical protein
VTLKFSGVNGKGGRLAVVAVADAFDELDDFFLAAGFTDSSKSLSSESPFLFDIFPRLGAFECNREIGILANDLLFTSAEPNRRTARSRKSKPVTDEVKPTERKATVKIRRMKS